jgi:hypothetical protein
LGQVSGENNFVLEYMPTDNVFFFFSATLTPKTKAKGKDSLTIPELLLAV